MNGHDINRERVDVLGKSLDDAMLDAINALPPEDRALMCGKVRDGLTDAPVFRIVDGDAARDDEWDGDLGTLAEHAGIDTSRCEFCSGPLDDSDPWRRGLDGCGAHERCLKGWL